MVYTTTGWTFLFLCYRILSIDAIFLRFLLDNTDDLLGRLGA